MKVMNQPRPKFEENNFTEKVNGSDSVQTQIKVSAQLKDLLQAVESEDSNLLKQIANSKSSSLFNEREQAYYQNCIFFLVQMKNEALSLEVIKTMKERGADIFMKDLYGQSPFFYVC